MKIEEMSDDTSAALEAQEAQEAKEESVKDILCEIAGNTSELANINYQLDRIANVMEAIVGYMRHPHDDKAFVRTSALD